VANGSGVSRGDRNRNARLGRLRGLVPVSNAIVGIDLADAKQMVVVTDHDSKVLARKTFRCRAWDLGVALDWAADRAQAKGWWGVTVACEPTGHRWRVLGQLVAERGMPFVCVQPLLMSGARRSEDLTFDKTDLHRPRRYNRPTATGLLHLGSDQHPAQPHVQDLLRTQTGGGQAAQPIRPRPRPPPRGCQCGPSCATSAATKNGYRPSSPPLDKKIENHVPSTMAIRPGCVGRRIVGRARL
jgi:Transposase